MKQSGDKASTVLTRHCSAEQEGYSMKTEWSMMHQFPDQRKQRSRSICSVSPSLSNTRRRCHMMPQPCTHLMHAAFDFREIVEWTEMRHGEAVKNCDCTLQAAPFRVNPQHTTTWADTQSTLQEIMAKLWEDSLFKKTGSGISCVKPEHTSLIVTEKNADTLGRYSALPRSWSEKAGSGGIKVSFKLLAWNQHVI